MLVGLLEMKHKYLSNGMPHAAIPAIFLSSVLMLPQSMRCLTLQQLRIWL